MSDVIDASTAEPPLQSPALTPPPSRGPRGWHPRIVPTAALVVGLVIGSTVGAVLASSDPTTSAEYQALARKLGSAETQVAVERGDAEAARSGAEQSAAAAQSAQAEASASQAALVERENAVASREAAVSAVEKQVAANSIGEGTWTVGSDVAAGTYRTAAAVTGDCYWSITRSGTNGSDIVENDLPTGGFPTVVLRAGQDFTNHGCGTFVKK